MRLYSTALYITHSLAEWFLSLCQSIHFFTETPHIPDQQEQLANNDWQYGENTDDHLEERKKSKTTEERGEGESKGEGREGEK